MARKKQIRITANSEAGVRAINALKKGMSKSAQNAVVAKVAFYTLRNLVTNTPKRWTGNTRRGWKVRKVSNAHWRVFNQSKVMRFLEYGTKAHGPRRAKALFIPLNRRASLTPVATIMRRNQAAIAAGRKPPYVMGRDFIFAKKVKGIKAIRIVYKQKQQSARVLGFAMKEHIKRTIRMAGLE